MRAGGNGRLARLCRAKRGSSRVPPCNFRTETRNYLSMSIPLSLDGKVALITGGSRGIGAATVRMFVAAGAPVTLKFEKTKTQSGRLGQVIGQKESAAIQSNFFGN